MSSLHRLAAAGVGLLVDLSDDDPVVVHWGPDLGDAEPDPALLHPAVPRSSFDAPVRPSLLPQLARGWRGRPAVAGDRGGHDFSPRFVLTDSTGDARSLELSLADTAGELRQ